MHESSYSKMEWFKNSFLSMHKNLKILDVCSLDDYGYYNFQTIFNCPNWNYIGLDLKEGNNVDIIVEDIYNWNEIEDNSYDVIISGKFGQIKYFWKTMSEIKRAIKFGGYICIITPTNYHIDHNLEIQNNFQINDFHKLAKYFNLEILHTSYDENSPWKDICIIAQNNDSNNTNLENKINHLKNKEDLLFNFRQCINNFNKMD